MELDLQIKFKSWWSKSEYQNESAELAIFTVIIYPTSPRLGVSPLIMGLHPHTSGTIPYSNFNWISTLIINSIGILVLGIGPSLIVISSLSDFNFFFELIIIFKAMIFLLILSSYLNCSASNNFDRGWLTVFQTPLTHP